jgi:two-component system, chemotaxis family, sensor kinase CheA
MSDQNKQAFPSFDNEMAEILDSFLVETKEIFERLGQDLLTLENGTENPELLNTIFRAVHTVKGTSSFLGFEQMTSLAHTFEDVLNKLRRGEIKINSNGMDVILEAFDLLKLLLERIEQKNPEQIDLSKVIDRLRYMAEHAGGVADKEKGEVSSRPTEATVQSQSVTVSVNPIVPESASADNQDGSSGTVAQTQNQSERATAKQTDSTIRVDVGRLDNLMNLVGELVLGRNRLTQISDVLSENQEGSQLARELSDTCTQIDFITTELQMAVMKTRMVPIAKVFNRLPRLVRDLSKETGKEIDLEMTGEETELDKSIIEELNDPLIHIIRNAADHGVELPDVRVQHGKQARGKVKVAAAHEGNHIVISIEDDGKGMDPEKLKKKAIERGMITAAEAQEMSAREAYNLIFAPGFSTAEKVTNVSGRGVGMDVVKTNISNLKGIIEIDSTLGVGSKFVIKLPLTLAIIQALLVQIGKDILSIPLASVLEVRRIQNDEIETINGKEVIRLRNSVLPLTRVEYIVKPPDGENKMQWMYVVVLALGEQRLGIVVDSLLGQKEVVIKSLGNYLGTIPGIAGSTILGDGRVIMIVDVGELMKLCKN